MLSFKTPTFRDERVTPIPLHKSPADRLAALPSPILFALFFAAIALSHLTLLHLPYFWDEGGYYIPAALDFYRHFTLIPEFTNAHPPLPNVVLGTLWHLTGFNILTTRLTASAFAAAGLLAVFRLTQRILSPSAAIATTFLTAIYPIWFAQSTLAHADIFAAAFTLAAFALYLPSQNCHPELREGSAFRSQRQNLFWIATLFSLAVLSKETAIVEPAILAAIELFFLIQTRTMRVPPISRTWRSGSPPATESSTATHLHHLLALSFPLLPLIAWFAYHHHKTGFTFGNPEYLRYNATANLTLAHISQALYYRGLHLLWQRNIWLPILLTVACLLLPDSENPKPKTQNLKPVFRTIALLILGNWLAFSVLGGALLTRYLLPVYPLILLACVAIWRDRTRYWPALAAITAAAFLTAIWLNPPTSFAPEDNLTYRDMVVVHQEATAYIASHYPDATVLTAWPAAAELFRPDLGYVQHSIKVFPIENFTSAEIQKAAQTPGKFDTALVFTTHYTSPALARYLLKHPNTHRGREFAEDRDLRPTEIATILHGTLLVTYERNGEWAAVIRFNRTYEARLSPPTIKP
jgi:4-amino-4-deoxy-L-arabinose transferase-like glycosyltransferase